jgi:hypothetical protein
MRQNASRRMLARLLSNDSFQWLRLNTVGGLTSRCDLLAKRIAGSDVVVMIIIIIIIEI